MEAPYPGIKLSGNNYQGFQLGSNSGIISVNELGKLAVDISVMVGMVVIHNDLLILTRCSKTSETRDPARTHLDNAFSP